MVDVEGEEIATVITVAGCEALLGRGHTNVTEKVAAAFSGHEALHANLAVVLAIEAGSAV